MLFGVCVCVCAWVLINQARDVLVLYYRTNDCSCIYPHNTSSYTKRLHQTCGPWHELWWLLCGVVVDIGRLESLDSKKERKLEQRGKGQQRLGQGLTVLMLVLTMMLLRNPAWRLHFVWFVAVLQRCYCHLLLRLLFNV